MSNDKNTGEKTTKKVKEPKRSALLGVLLTASVAEIEGRYKTITAGLEASKTAEAHKAQSASSAEVGRLEKDRAAKKREISKASDRLRTEARKARRESERAAQSILDKTMNEIETLDTDENAKLSAEFTAAVAPFEATLTADLANLAKNHAEKLAAVTAEFEELTKIAKERDAKAKEEAKAKAEAEAAAKAQQEAEIEALKSAPEAAALTETVSASAA